MAFSRINYTSNGSTVNYTFSFPYLNKADIFVFVAGVSVPFTFLNTSTVTCTAVPASGASVQVRRSTQKSTVPVDFTDGSVLLEKDLDLLAAYTLYVTQESDDTAVSALRVGTATDFDATGLRITSLAAGTLAGDAVNKAQLDTIAGSASAAAASASSAASSKAAIDNKYRGALATDPTTRTDSTANQLGDEVFNTTAGLLKRWNGTSWQASDLSTANLAASGGASLIGGGGQLASSIPALRTLLKTSASKNAVVTGYYAAGDGGGGVYYYDAADAASADNGGTVIVAADGGRWKLAHTGSVSVKQFGAKADCSGFAGTDNAATINNAAAVSAAQGFKLTIPKGRYLLSALTAIIDGYNSEWYFVRLWDNLHIEMEPGAQLVAASGLAAANAAAQGAKGFEFFSDAKQPASNWTVEGGELDHNPLNNLIPATNGWGNQVTTPSILLSGGGNGGTVRGVHFKGNPGHNSIKNENHADLLIECNRFSDFADSIVGNTLVTDHSAVYTRGARTIIRDNRATCATQMYRGGAFEIHSDGARAYDNYVEGVGAAFLCASYAAGVTPEIHIYDNVSKNTLIAVAFDIADTLGLTAHIRGNKFALTGLPYKRDDPYGRATHDAFTMRQGSNYSTGAIKIYIDDNEARQATPVSWAFADDIVNCPFKFHKSLDVKARNNRFYGFRGAVCDYGIMLNDLGTFEFSGNKYYNCGSPSAVVAHSFMNDSSTSNGNRPLLVLVNDEFVDCGYSFLSTASFVSAGTLFFPLTLRLTARGNTYIAPYYGPAPQGGTIAVFDAGYKCQTTPSYGSTLDGTTNVVGSVVLDVLSTNARHAWKKLLGATWKYVGTDYLYAGVPSTKINPFGDVAGDRATTINYAVTEPTAIVCTASGVGPNFVGTWAKIGVVPA